MKLIINRTTFEAATASEIIKAVWEANTYNAPKEISDICSTITHFVVEEELVTGFNATLNHEPTMLALLDWIDTIKNEYNFPVVVEYNDN